MLSVRLPMYLVLARRWRPQTFDEVLGQEPIVRTLKNALAQGRIAHAYLFSGPRGVGKTSTARILAKALNCKEGPTPNPCNVCEFCTGIAQGTAVDVLEIDGASNTGVDNIRELRETVAYRPIRSRYKVYIIDEVHMLSTSAFNALLKTLEEPPPHVVFVFATTEPQKVPLTVVSRCQRFEFRRIPEEVILGQLEKICQWEGIKVTSEALKLIAERASGSLRDAESLLDQVVAYSDRKVIDVELVRELLGLPDQASLKAVVQYLMEGDALSAIREVEGLYRRGVPLEEFLQGLLGYLRDLLVERLEGKNPMDPFQLRFWFQLCLRALGWMRKAEVDKLVLEMTMVEMAFWRELVSVGELIKSLEAKVPVTELSLPQKEGVQSQKEVLLLEEHKSGREDQGHERLKELEQMESVQAEGPFDKAVGFSWEELLKAVSGESPIIGAFLRQGTFLGLRDGKVVIEMPSGFLVETLSERENRMLIEKVILSVFGQRLRVDFSLTEPPVPKVQKEEPEESILKEVLEVLGGKVVEERPS